MIDLRSDTVTKPTQKMREAMMNAAVGDDVFGEDPTVNLLQSTLAEKFGLEAGLFCPSGTMTNQIAINVHTSPGDEVICDQLSHVYNYEGGGIARNSGCSVKLIQSTNCQISLEDVKTKINPSDSHYARTSLLCVEDTVNKGGGVCYEFDQLKSLSEFSKEEKLAYHLDGARVVNALVAKGHNWESYGSLFDSISVCLSKGLGTPGGSVLLGSQSFIDEAHRVRKVMGGGMRQTGMLAAAGLYALENNVDRMIEDHQKARLLGECLKDQKWVSNVVPVETNIVVFELDGIPAVDFQAALAQNGILAMPFGPTKMRFVTHLDFNDQDLSSTIKCLEQMPY